MIWVRCRAHVIFLAVAIGGAGSACGGGGSEGQADREVFEVELPDDTTTLEVGTTTRLPVVARNWDGDEVPEAPLNWSSSDSTVATVDSTGLVTAVGATLGFATITAEGATLILDETTVEVSVAFAAVSAGTSHTCGVTTENGAYCWGDNDHGKLGNGTTAATGRPAAVSGDLAFASVSAGASHTCGVTTDGAAYCWGWGNGGRLGSGDATDTRVPASVAGGLMFQSVSAGASHSCGITTEGAAYCWGSGQGGEGILGRGEETDSPVPLPVAGGLTFGSVSAGIMHTCGVSGGNATHCWGMNLYGQVGVGSPSDDAFLAGSAGPAPVGEETEWRSVSAGDSHTCGVTGEGDVYCWGNDQMDQTGTDSEDCGEGGPCVWRPALVRGGIQFQSVSAGKFQTCGVTTSGDAYCWGEHFEDGPSPVPGGHKFESVSTGYHACGLTTEGVAYCWGLNNYGQLGNGTTTRGVAFDREGLITPTRVIGQR